MAPKGCKRKKEEDFLDNATDSQGAHDYNAPDTSRSRLQKHSECLQDSDVSELDYDDPDSDTEELNFAPAEAQIEEELQRELNEAELVIPECEDVGKLVSASYEGNDDEHAKFERIVKQIDKDGWLPMIQYAIETEKQSGSVLGKAYFDELELWKEFCFLTLSSIPAEVIQELTHGNLVLEVERNRRLKDTLNLYFERTKHQPFIYARVHVDEFGSAMSVKDAQRLVKSLRRYVSENDDILSNEDCQKAFWHIDRQYGRRWKRANTDNGLRRFLGTKGNLRSEDRVDVLSRFCDGLERRFVGTDETSLLSPPLLYIGYAARGDIRKRQHEACGESSNWLATLVQSICNTVWGRQSYRMHFFAVCPLGEEPEGPVAEMLLTRVPGAYYHNGGGFCIDIAGKSMESIHFATLSVVQREDTWNEALDWVYKNTPFEENWTRKAKIQREARDKLQYMAAPREERQAMFDEVAELHAQLQRIKDRPRLQDESSHETIKEIEALHEKLTAREKELASARVSGSGPSVD